jgi:hypothetical protein
MIDKALMQAARARWRTLNASHAVKDVQHVQDINFIAEQTGESPAWVLCQACLAEASQLVYREGGVPSQLISTIARRLLEAGDVSADEIIEIIGAIRPTAH